MRAPGPLLLFGVTALISCGPSNLELSSPRPSLDAYAQHRGGGPPSGGLDELRFRDGLCSGEPMSPEREKLTEEHLVTFLKRQNLAIGVERARTDLVFVVLNGAGTRAPARLRVAILQNADEAGRELHEALLEHGMGSWGIHRSNLAVLGPAGSHSDTLTFAAQTKLACWGVFTVADRDDTFVVPGGYTEI